MLTSVHLQLLDKYPHSGELNWKLRDQFVWKYIVSKFTSWTHAYLVYRYPLLYPRRSMFHLYIDRHCHFHQVMADTQVHRRVHSHSDPPHRMCDHTPILVDIIIIMFHMYIIYDLFGNKFWKASTKSHIIACPISKQDWETKQLPSLRQPQFRVICNSKQCPVENLLV